jgi:hypothetical protein
LPEAIGNMAGVDPCAKREDRDCSNVSAEMAHAANFLRDKAFGN